MQISRVKRSKMDARRTYDRLSNLYDILAGASETELMQLGSEMLGVHPGESVLEIGSGTGKAQVWFSQLAGDEGRVHGLDLSPGMLNVAHHQLTKAGSVGRNHLLCGDGVSLPYASQAFSAVFMSFTLELFDTPDIPLVLAECWRVLQPGGRLGVVAMSKLTQSNPIIRLYEWFHEHFPTYVDCRPIDAQSMIQAAGFTTKKQSIKSMWGLPVELLVASKLIRQIT